jgi:hypothetical protein
MNDSIIAATANTASSNGWEFRVNRDILGFTLPGTSGGPGGDSVPEPGVAVGKWSHVAAVLGADGKVSFYVDGQLKHAGTEALVSPIPDTDDVLLIGARQTHGSSAPSGFFEGAIDDLRVYRTALSAADVKEIYDEAPVLQLRFDEARGATSFADAARAGVNGSCSQPTCPETGDAIRGQIGLAARYDGADDVVTVADATALSPAAFTVGAWVKPGGVRAAAQRLVSKGSGSSLSYRLSLDPNSLVPRLEACSTTITGSVPLVDGQWSQLLGTYDGSKLHLYVNGNEANPHPVSLAAGCTNTAPLVVGARRGKTRRCPRARRSRSTRRRCKAGRSTTCSRIRTAGWRTGRARTSSSTTTFQSRTCCCL